MAIGPHRPLFYVVVLAIGFVVGGLLSALLEWALPPSPAKEFFTFTVTPSIGALYVNLLVFSVTVGPIALQVSLLAIVGVVLAYLVARSLF